MSASSASKKLSVDSSKPSRVGLRRADSSNSLNTTYSRYYYIPYSLLYYYIHIHLDLRYTISLNYNLNYDL